MRVYPNGSGKYGEPYEIPPDFGKTRPVSLCSRIARAQSMAEINGLIDEVRTYGNPSHRTARKWVKAVVARTNFFHKQILDGVAHPVLLIPEAK